MLIFHLLFGAPRFLSIKIVSQRQRKSNHACYISKGNENSNPYGQEVYIDLLLKLCRRQIKKGSIIVTRDMFQMETGHSPGLQPGRLPFQMLLSCKKFSDITLNCFNFCGIEVITFSYPYFACLICIRVVTLTDRINMNVHVLMSSLLC